MRTLIYARYSSRLQNELSVADQIAACRARAAREGWTIAGVYSDHAISGAAGIGTDQRPGMFAMLERVEAGGVDQVLTESTDRIARHQGDSYAIRELLDAAGVRLFTLMEGEVDEITGTIKGLMDARVRKDMAQRVRRGQIGSVERGRAGSGMAYGYRRVVQIDDRGQLVRGLREIDEEKARIVRRIFHEFVGGQSANAIAARLNAEGLPPPRKGIWRASTLIGHRAIGFGILANPIYIGQILYGRSKQWIHPRTRDRRSKPGDGDIRRGEAPHLRIIDDETWTAAQAELERRSCDRPETQRRPKHILSGLGKCGLCGGNWIIRSKGWWGCSHHIGGKACTNNRMISSADYERRVLADLKDQMLAPDVVAAYLRQYHREHARQSADLGREHERAQRRLDEANRKIGRLVEAIAAGGSEFADIRDALAAARNDRDRLAKQIAGIKALPVLTLHPGLADQYRRSIEDLSSALAAEETRIEAIPRLRKLIARIVVTPAASANRGVDLQVIRHVDEILSIARLPSQAAKA